MLRKTIFKIAAFLFLFPFQSFANTGTDFLRSTGKIYSVVLVIVILFLGIVFSLIRLERRIKELEKTNLNE